MKPSQTIYPSTSLVSLNAMQYCMESFKALLRDPFNTFNLHLFDYVIEDVNHFGRQELLTFSAYEHFNIHFKRA